MFKKEYFVQINIVIVNIIFASLDTQTDTSRLKFLVSFRFGSFWNRRDFFFFPGTKKFYCLKNYEDNSACHQICLLLVLQSQTGTIKQLCNTWEILRITSQTFWPVRGPINYSCQYLTWSRYYFQKGSNYRWT